MTPQDRYEQAKRIFLEICDLEGEERGAALERLCADDTVMRDEVQSLLAHYYATGIGPESSHDMETTDLPARGSEGSEGTPPPRRRERERRTEQVGPYRILHELGRGGMGVVYLGVRDDEELRQQFAVKLLRRGMDTEDVLGRFQLERKLLGALNHPGIARLYDAGEADDGRPYFVMEHVEGVPLDRYADERRLSVAERLELFRKVCDAVHYAHQNLIVHRDLKPGNILVTDKGQPKLLDFGIAKLINPAFQPLIKDPTAPEIRVMTPEYASPEQVRGEAVSTASDVYALGVILYELLCGHRPYRITRRIREEIMRVVCEVEPDRPSTASTKIEDDGTDGAAEPRQAASSGSSTVTPEGVSRSRGVQPTRLRKQLAGDLDNIVLMAMRKEPQRRYASAEALAEDLQRHVAGQPVVARPDTLGYRTAKFVRRNRVAVAAASVVLVAIVTSAIVSAAGWREADRQATAATTAQADAEQARDRAQRRFDLVRGIATSMMYDVHDRVAPLDGALPAREILVTRAEEYLDALAEEAGDDTDLLAELADANDRVGEMRGGVRNPSQGDVGKAKERYERALELRTRLVALEPERIDRQRAVIDSHRGLGDLARRANEGAVAVEHAEVALAIARTLAANHGDDPIVQRELALCLGDVGAAYRVVGRRAEMAAAYEESIAIRRALLDANPDDPRAVRGYTVLLNRVANLRVEDGTIDEGIALYEESLAARQQLADADPDNGRARRDLAVVHYLLAGVLLDNRRIDAAREHAETALALYARRVADNPTDQRSIQDHMLGLELATRIALSREQLDAASRHAENARQAAASLLALDPENPRYLFFAGRGAELEASVASARGAEAAAQAAIDEAIAIYTTLHQTHGDDVGVRQSLAFALQSQATMLQESGQDLAGMRAAESARGHFAALRTLMPDDPLLRDGHAGTLLTLSRLLIRFESTAEARTNASLAADIARDIDAEFLHDLARVLHETGASETARSTAQRALALLPEADPRRATIEDELRAW